MANIERLDISPIFVALTRPPMIFGVTVDYLFLNIMLVMSLFMLSDSAWMLICFLPLHVFGYVGCKKDPNFFRVVTKKLQCPIIPNKKLWGCQSYEPL